MIFRAGKPEGPPRRHESQGRQQAPRRALLPDFFAAPFALVDLDRPIALHVEYRREEFCRCFAVWTGRPRLRCAGRGTGVLFHDSPRSARFLSIKVDKPFH
jgi:hypothetical protein